MADIQVTNSGAIFVFTPLNPSAEEFCSERFPDDGYLRIGNGYAVEARYAPDIADDMINNGLELV